MTELQSIDTALFRFVNQSMANPVCDWLMPRLAGHPLFVPVLLLGALWALWRGGRRERVFVLLLLIAIGLADGAVSNTIKKAVARPRPCIALSDTRALIGCSGEGSMPSAHATNWFAAAMVCFVYYRRSWRFMLPSAALIGFSRVYDGVHYPSDVIAGAILGAGSAMSFLWCVNALWIWAGRAWFPLWWQRIPSLIDFGPGQSAPQTGKQDQSPVPSIDLHWIRAGYVLIAALLLFRLGYLASGTIELSKDEAYQWLWSKHLALSYYSKPPGIAFLQFAGTSLWGDKEFGVRFFSPVIAAILSFALLRFLGREIGGRQSFLLLLFLTCTPLLGVGTILMTIDPPLVLFWTLSMIAAWRAVQPKGTTGQWIWAGVCAGLGFLFKYSSLYLVVCWGLYMLFWKPARVHLSKAGPYLAVAMILLCTTPVLVWNWQNGWITVRHVADNAGLDKTWKPTLRFFWEFIFAEAGLLNPVFFVGAVWAMVGFWKRRQEKPIWLYFFCLSAPIFLGHWIYSLHSRVQPNWIAPAVPGMFCLGLDYWDTRRREGLRWIRPLAIAGVVLGLFMVVVLHQTNLIGRITGRQLPGEMDPLRRVRAWRETARVAGLARLKLMQEGKPVFIITDHYGLAGEFSFYLTEAKAALHSEPLVYSKPTIVPNNQLYFWPEYHYERRRTGQNAIYVAEIGPLALEKDWIWKWLRKKPIGYNAGPRPVAPPALLLEQFETVTDLGPVEVKIRDRVFRRLELFECRNMR
jgi:membrane-associated phospholipid phosphatase